MTPPDLCPPAELAHHIDAFEAALDRDPAADLAAFLPPAGHPLYHPVLGELIRVDLDRAWAAGRGRRLDEYRRRFPTAFADPGLLQGVAFEEYRQRRLHGEDVSAAEYRTAYGIDTSDWPDLAGGSINDPGTLVTPIRAASWAAVRGLSRIDRIDSAVNRTLPPAELIRLPGIGADAGESVAWPAHPSVMPTDGLMLGDLGRSDPESVYRWLQSDRTLPEPGSEFLGFRLVEELGRGAFGRVYLAHQGDLAGRPVAVKVACDLVGESRTLAQLQHTNIVPVYSVHKAGPLQAVCMPYFGRTTLARVVQRVSDRPSLPNSGRELKSTVDMRQGSTVTGSGLGSGVWGLGSGQTPNPKPQTPDRPDSQPDGWTRLEGLSYVEAVLWLGAQLADGLAHAHARGILHRDLKPANVLLTDDGRPMLLDFNLAEDTKLRGSADGAAIGGTLPYMSPEQLAAFDKTAKGLPKLDGRSDLYSLGVVLFELLTGRHPFPTYAVPGREAVPRMLADRRQPPPSVREHNPAVTQATEAIIHMCLAADSADRYRHAVQLRDDLERQLAHRPLKHAPEPSWRERVEKWARRHPRLTSAGTVAVAALVLVSATSATAVYARERSRDAHARAALTDHTEAFRDAQLTVGSRDQSRSQLAKRMESLRGVLDRYGVPADGDSEAWLSAPDVARLSEADRQRLREEVGEAFYLMAQTMYLTARATDEPGERTRFIASAGQWNAAAERLAADRLPWAVRQQQADLADLRGDFTTAGRLRQEAEAIPADSARDRYFVAARLTDRGQPGAALPHLTAATQHDPADLSAWFLRGAVHLEVGQPELAALCFGACTALRPDHAPAWLNRGVAYTRVRFFDLALADFDKAVALDPDLTRAYLERAIAREQQGQLKASLTDYDRATATPDAPPLAFFRRADLRRKLNDPAGAADVAEGFRRPCLDAVSWVARSEVRLAHADAFAALGGVAASSTVVPRSALADVKQALALDPEHPDALQQSAHILSEHLGREAESVAALDKLVRARPDSAVALAGRGVLLARAGHRDRAVADAKAAVLADPKAPTLYQVAGVYAHSAKANLDDRRQALHLLWSALKTGYGLDLVDGDSDLDPIRGDAEFRQVVGRAKAIHAALAK